MQDSTSRVECHRHGMKHDYVYEAESCQGGRNISCWLLWAGGMQRCSKDLLLSELNAKYPALPHAESQFLGLEKAFRITKCNHQPDLLSLPPNHIPSCYAHTSLKYLQG